jgi:isocitrate/isopropylmalate dehydrogenase
LRRRRDRAILADMDILVLPGDGIGPEISATTSDVLVAADRVFSLDLRLVKAEIGLVTLQREGTTLSPSVMAAARAAAGIVLGPVSHDIYPPREEGGINVSGELRIALDLYAKIRPSRSRPGIGRAHGTMDLVIVRENTEGFYADRNMAVGIGELMPTADMALAIRKITAAACRRIASSAFALARTRRRKVTAVHKAHRRFVTRLSP